MKVWFDTEFQDCSSYPSVSGPAEGIVLLSLGAVREDGEQFYAENGDANLELCDPWVQANVIPQFTGPVWSREMIVNHFIEFCGPNVELWAYYGGYDWWLLCQLMGGFSRMPYEGLRYFGDVKALSMLFKRHNFPIQNKQYEHHALHDALWTKQCWDYVTSGRKSD